MNIRIPVYAEEQMPQASGFGHARPVSLRPLFFAQPREQDERLQRATVRLANQLRRELGRLARSARHEELAAYGFYPPMEEKILALTLEVGKKHVSLRHLFVILPAFGRRFAWTPSVPEVWIEMGRGENLRDRAQEAFTEHYRQLERRFGSEAVQPDTATISGKAWLTSLEISIDVPGLHTPPVENFFASLGSGEAIHGAAELERVGRSLNVLYPDDLEHAFNREEEVVEVTTMLGASDLRPVLLVGKRLVGKTAIIHECVRRRMDRRRSSEATMHVGSGGGVADLVGDVWLIGPQRLISGMSFVGQWEGRLLAILKEAQLKRHSLYFDDLIGLFYSGRSSSSQLSVAQVLKPFIERRDVRVLAEVTPEALRVLQELDRSFVDLFQLVRIEEPNEEKNLQTLLGYRRALEGVNGSRFYADVLPTVIDLTRRYVPDAAFPGKAATLMRALAAKHKGSNIGRDDALGEFSARSGLSVRFLDDRTELNHTQVVDALGNEVIGQKAAVAACADAVTIAKARLNDNTRPIASFLFLGPTGVGKTQCAKALANYLFGERERILRFDMNEFASYYSVARLTGTFDAPEGLLTSAVRRAPFAVVLFDEIEKAHPAVFDLLLGVMGDGRLTDARGQLVDFSNTIIILTSNLGAREAASELGFRQTNRSDASVYRLAAEKFFKPEFFNRLTRVVPFERLRREDVQRIARGLMEDVFKREGLVRRGVKLIVETSALNLLVDAGYHPQFGARALKRTLERQVTAPIAARLSATPLDQPLIIFLKANHGSITVEARSMVVNQTAAPIMQVPYSDTGELLDLIEDALVRIEDVEHSLRPAGEILIGDAESNLAQMQHFYFREQTRRVTRMLDRADERRARQGHTSALGGPRTNRQTVGASRFRGSRSAPARGKGHKRQLARITAAADSASGDVFPEFDNTLFGHNLHRLLLDLSARSKPYGDQIDDYLRDLLSETALLDAWETIVAPSAPKGDHGANEVRKSDALGAHGAAPTTLLRIASLDEEGRSACMHLRDLYRTLFDREFNCKLVNLGSSTGNETHLRAGSHEHVETLLFEDPLAALLAPLEAGTHLFVSSSETYAPVVVSVNSTDRSVSQASSDEDSVGLPPVLRIYSEPDATLDLRTHLLATGKVSSAELRAFVLSALPLPREFNLRK